MQNAEVKRATRVAERIKEEVATILVTLRDPRLIGAIVSRVQVTDDLQLARVYIRSLSEIGPEARKAMLQGFERAGPRMRRDLAKAVSLRYAPVLKFHFDEGADQEKRVEELLREIADEKKA